MSNIKHLDNLVVVDARIRLFSGKRALDDDETPDNGGDVVTWGSKWVIDRAKLKPFNRLKMEVERIKRNYGAKFLDAAIAPPERGEMMLEKIQPIQPRFEDAKANFIAEYPQAVYEWAEKPTNVAWRQSIIDSAPDVDEVAQRISFRVGAYKIGVIDQHNELLEEEIAGLAGQVAKEIATDVRCSFEGGDGKTTQRVKNLLTRVRSKLKDFAFLDPVLLRTVDTIDQVVGKLPRTGPIEGADFMLLQSLIGLLSSPKQIMNGDAMPVLIDDPEEMQMQYAAPTIFAPVGAPVDQSMQLDWAF